MKMDIRVINSEGELINATRLHIMARNVFLIGLTENMEKEVLIERCRSKEEAIAYLDAVKDAIKVGQEEQLGSVLIDLECKEYIPLEGKKCKCEGGCKCNGESEHD
jgi:hypothetical protein